VKIKEPEIVYKRGKPTSVILPLAQYEEMLELIEDAADLKYLRKIREEGPAFRPLSEYLKAKKRGV
jgi:hypothetical protein